MNLQHLKYALEVEKTGSISKAAENLYINQPHLSKSIRELEANIGISIFDRTSKGVFCVQRNEICGIHVGKSVMDSISKRDRSLKPSV